MPNLPIPDWAKPDDTPPSQGIDLYIHQAQAFWASWTDWIVSNALRIAVALVVGALIVAALMGVRWLAIRVCRMDRSFSRWPTIVAKALTRTSLWFCIAVAAKLVQGYADTPPAVASTIYFFFTIAVVLQVAVWVRELILGLVEHRAGGPDEQTNLASALGLIRVLVTVTLFAVALLMILDNLGVNVTGLIAGLGIGGIAIGLAAKGIFDDLFSALSIIFDRPFRRGDMIRWDDTQGRVEAIGLKTTRVRAQTGEEVIISNTNILNKELRNLARLESRRVILKLGLTYQTSPEICAGLPDRLRGIVGAVEKCSVNRCAMIGFGDSSLDFELWFDVASQDLKEIFDKRGEVCVAILTAFNAAGIEIAYPTQVQYTAAPDGRLVLPYAEPAAAPASPQGAPSSEGTSPRP